MALSPEQLMMHGLLANKYNTLAQDPCLYITDRNAMIRDFNLIEYNFLLRSNTGCVLLHAIDVCPTYCICIPPCIGSHISGSVMCMLAFP